MKIDEDQLRIAFDEAMRLRDSGQLRNSIAVLEAAVGPDPVNEVESDAARKLVAHSLAQLGYMYERLGNDADALRRFCEATLVRPTMELASLGLFHVLFRQDLVEEALAEAVRFLTLRESELYRELFSGEGFRDNLLPQARALANQARALVARHRAN